MSKDTNTTPRGEHTGQPDTEYKDFPRFNAFVNKVRADKSKLTRGVSNEQEKTIQTETL